ncbi:hypothetical protein Afil01_49120 [Actinorhabdospora filicis]|uniref:Uncharacterized protein n=1 Tax=Actinorhabdospora filicis TaxID=1785913 RepID=A0A9W6WCS8_9ACTN|nr:hypothetical protein [Actinorhabdospora filicis]GLZ80105.1 hypothetical protein Afil01_49120 [Actinorhabdospora filicis]
MSLLDGVASHWIRIAADRWPKDLREDLTSEWLAEMSVMGGLRRLRFAFSLAASPPVGDENGVPMGWREIVPGLGRRVRPFLVLFLAGFATMLMAGAVSVLAGAAEQLTTGFSSLEKRTPLGIGLYILVTLIAYASFGLFGTLLARRHPVARGPRTAASRLLWTLAAVAAVAAGMTTQTLLFGSGPVQTVAVGMWAATAGIVCVGAVLIARGGLLWLGRVLGVGLGLILFDLACIEIGLRQAAARVLGVGEGGSTYDAGPYIDPARVDVSHGPLWFPSALIGPSPNAGRAPDSDIEIAWWLSSVVIGMMLGLLLIVCYTVRTAIPAPAARATKVAVPVPVAPVRRGRPIALALTGVALATWAAALAFLPSRVVRYQADPEFGIWTYEVRLAAITLAVLGLAFALTGRGRALWPALLAGFVLVVADKALSGTGLPEPTTAAIAAATGGLTSWAAWWLGVNVRGTATPQSVRRGRIVIALFAAVTAPALYLQATWPDTIDTDPPTPWGLPLGTAVICGGLAAMAVVAALSARIRPLRRTTGAVLATLSVLAFAAIGAVSGLPSEIPVLLALICGPWTIAITVLIAWNRPRRPWLSGIRWVLAAIVSIPAQIAVFYILMVPGFAAEEYLLAGAGFAGAWDGIGTFVTVLAIATGYALITARAMRERVALPPRPAWQPLPTV